MSMGGGTAGALIQTAVAAIEAGQAATVACVFGDAARTGGSRFSRASGWGDTWDLWGMYGAAANSALVASRHMAVHGTTSEQLAEVAVACRYHASLNPRAVMRTPITVADHQASRWIVEPLHLLDCCLISDGGVCVIVTSLDRAKDGPHPAVRIAGMGQAYTNRTLGNPDWLTMPHQKVALDAAYRGAGVGARDVDVAQLYDNFTISVLLWLEHGGLLRAGRRRVVRRGRPHPARGRAAGQHRRAATSPSPTWRAGCTSSRACSRSAARLASDRCPARRSASSPAAACRSTALTR